MRLILLGLIIGGIIINVLYINYPLHLTLQIKEFQYFFMVLEQPSSQPMSFIFPSCLQPPGAESKICQKWSNFHYLLRHFFYLNQRFLKNWWGHSLKYLCSQCVYKEEKTKNFSSAPPNTCQIRPWLPHHHTHVLLLNFVSIKLTQSNFMLWKTQMMGLIESQDMVRFIDGSIHAPPMYQQT